MSKKNPTSIQEVRAMSPEARCKWLNTKTTSIGKTEKSRRISLFVFAGQKDVSDGKLA